MALITDSRLHEILKPVSGVPDAITACNFTDRAEIQARIYYRNGPEISCKRALEIADIRSGAPESPDPGEGHIYRESISTSLSSMTTEAWNERGRRIEAARQRAEDSRPRCCPNCKGTVITPTFAEVGVDEWQCWNANCFATWVVLP